MQSTQTYTRRENARRAGVAAGVPRGRVAITVHKNGNEVRFGWKEFVMPIKKAVTTCASLSPIKAESSTRNGVKRPKAGGACAAVWAWLDANPGVTVKGVKAAALAHGWNQNNAVSEFYVYRKFMGINGRQLNAA